MIDTIEEWNKLHRYLSNPIDILPILNNQYYSRLVNVLNDKKAAYIDILMAYRDALNVPDTGCILPLPKNLPTPNDLILKLTDLEFDSFHHCLVTATCENPIDIRHQQSIFSLENRRNIAEFPIDNALQKKLKDPDYKVYRGSGQKNAVRLALTTERSNTLIINIPTGVGKTLVINAVTAYSARNELTLVIVPTTALAIEQSQRMKSALEKMDECHGGEYVWYGSQSELIKRDIKARIRNGEQKVLFVSPESACRSLLPILFEYSKQNKISNIIIDEAHIVEQWGATFRPDFQILAALIKKLRTLSTRGIKCILMSATYTSQTIRTLKELYGVTGKDVIEIHGSFIRPEISYKVIECFDDTEHLDTITRAIIQLPKPLILYCLTKEMVAILYNHLAQIIGLRRLATFTADTSDLNRKSIIKLWNDGDLDIIIATSAFGVGMDKTNIRTVIHAEVPENLDRYYQDVGRAGRDGVACQSLLIYKKESFDTAKRINSETLITTTKGFDRWKTLWNHKILSEGKVVLDLRRFRYGLDQESRANQEWNWRTLLLMQRAGFINVEFRNVLKPEWSPEYNDIQYQNLVNEYFEDYYSQIEITILEDQHLNLSFWEDKISRQRNIELEQSTLRFNLLQSWIMNPVSQCFGKILQDFYKLENSVPQYSCYSCPKCENSNSLTKPSRILGKFSFVDGFIYSAEWQAPLDKFNKQQYIYYPSNNMSEKKLVRNWRTWIAKLIEQGAVSSIVCTSQVAEAIIKQLPKGLDNFWMHESIDDVIYDELLWPQLILVSPNRESLPTFGWIDYPVIIIAPDNILQQRNANRKWWETNQTSLSLNNFLASL